ncbi:GPI-anchored cell wall organization ecm33 protein [Rutstroemia sp. NJR-2017a WRK4]|nr:GPI-anchored cell wall organization ecm33 protein [Rutstroemia sp. NJR-2017a WRK4]
MFAKTLLPALAVVGAAAAASSSTSSVNAICTQATATVNSAADATALAACSTISGSILIGPNVVGPINIDGPEEVTGDFIAENAGGLTTIESSSIKTIGGDFTLTNLTTLSTLSFAKLTKVATIGWSALPALPQLTMGGPIGEAASVLITNTFLNTLDGINLDTVNTLNINNNNRLKTFSTQVGTIHDLLNIDSNGKDLDVSFPNLIWAANMTFRNCSSISIPSLATVNGSLGFYENYFKDLSAPNLTTVGNTANGQGSLAFVANPSLANITIPGLTKVGGAFQIANNSALEDISFAKLATVGGAIDFSGNFSTPELPALNDVKGGFNMQSTAQIDCSGFKSEASSGNIQGTFTCKTTADAKSGTSSSGSGSSTTSGSGSSSTSKAAAASYGVNEALVGVSFVGGLLQMLL